MTEPADVPQQLDRMAEATRAILREVGAAVVGHDEVVEGVLACLLTGGHAVLEGVPGIGKTLLVRTLARVLALDFGRIQFTPDLMPADITGTNVLVERPDGGRDWEFRPGPVFANLLLADEINRATPKTQSALLEAMQERSVTVAGTTHPLPAPFFVLATQNPLEMEGTYPLPEAQLDRFMLKLLMRMPGREALGSIIDRTTGAEGPEPKRVVDGPALLAMRRLVREVPVASHVRDYAAALVLATHPEHPEAAPQVTQYVRYGASPRGAQALVLTGKVRALRQGRYNVAVEDIRAVVPAALRHRLILNFEGEAAGVAPDAILADLLAHVPVPGA